ncbi:hypothetical protein GQ457_01G010890 [Hibiscus cannabinus]
MCRSSSAKTGTGYQVSERGRIWGRELGSSDIQWLIVGLPSNRTPYTVPQELLRRHLRLQETNYPSRSQEPHIGDTPQKSKSERSERSNEHPGHTQQQSSGRNLAKWASESDSGPVNRVDSAGLTHRVNSDWVDSVNGSDSGHGSGRRVGSGSGRTGLAKPVRFKTGSTRFRPGSRPVQQGGDHGGRNLPLAACVAHALLRSACVDHGEKLRGGEAPTMAKAWSVRQSEVWVLSATTQGVQIWYSWLERMAVVVGIGAKEARGSRRSLQRFSPAMCGPNPRVVATSGLPR